VKSGKDKVKSGKDNTHSLKNIPRVGMLSPQRGNSLFPAWECFAGLLLVVESKHREQTN
jgi:hypothetical protein